MCIHTDIKARCDKMSIIGRVYVHVWAEFYLRLYLNFYPRVILTENIIEIWKSHEDKNTNAT